MANPNDPNDLQYASLGARFVGHIIDQMFLGVTLLLVAILPESVAGAASILWILFAIFYVLFLEWAWSGRTVGKYLVKTRVVTDDGGGIGPGASLVRNLVGLVGTAFGWIGLLVGALAIYQSGMNKRLGDSAAGTVVIKE